MVSYQEIELSVDYDFIPEQKETWDCPGSDAYIEITSVKLGGSEIIDLLPEHILSSIEQDCWDDIAAKRRDAEDAMAEERHWDRVNSIAGLCAGFAA